MNLKAVIWPAVFVFLWSTGFIGARYGLPHADPITLLAIRFAIVTVLLLLLAAAIPRRGAAAPLRWRDGPWIALAGLLMHGLYLGGVFVAISWGLEAGAAAVITGLSPIIAAIGGRLFLGETLTPLRVLGMGLGFGGVALVVSEKLAAGVGSPAAAALCVGSAFGFAAGALVQKVKLNGAPLLLGNAGQYAAVGVVFAALALLIEPNRVELATPFILAMAWLVFALSIGAILLLYVLLRRGEAGSVSSLTFLVPGSTAFIAWLLFGETLGPEALAGFVLSGIGVALVSRPSTPR
ncbi:MAG: DMT family transporter [Neomegalonema sp.]|nr:DMT family transporter [Neomegalonema sp.]